MSQTKSRKIPTRNIYIHYRTFSSRYSPGNAAFTTGVFTVPATDLWLDMDSRWGTSAANCDPADLERCQAYA